MTHGFTPADTAILLVDHQPGVVHMTQSVPAAQLAANAATLAKLGTELHIPLVLTTTREDMAFLGTTIPEIQKVAPSAYAARIQRGGSLDAFSDPAFVAAVAATGRRNLVIAGITTDVCLFHSVTSALELGYAVMVAADACGSGSALGDDVTYARLREAGAIVSTTYGILFGLFPDLATPEGQLAEQVAETAIVKTPVQKLFA